MRIGAVVRNPAGATRRPSRSPTSISRPRWKRQLVQGRITIDCRETSGSPHSHAVSRTAVHTMFGQAPEAWSAGRREGGSGLSASPLAGGVPGAQRDRGRCAAAIRRCAASTSRSPRTTTTSASTTRRWITTRSAPSTASCGRWAPTARPRPPTADEAARASGAILDSLRAHPARAARLDPQRRRRRRHRNRGACSRSPSGMARERRAAEALDPVRVAHRRGVRAGRLGAGSPITRRCRAIRSSAEIDMDMVGRGTARRTCRAAGRRYLEVVGAKRLSREFGEHARGGERGAAACRSSSTTRSTRRGTRCSTTAAPTTTATRATASRRVASRAASTWTTTR